MKMTNTSGFDTAALRALVCAVHRHVATTEGRLKTWPSLHVRVFTGYGRCSHGRASLSGYRMTLRLVRGCSYSSALWLARHELYHNYGYNHRAYRDIDRRPVDAIAAALGVKLTDLLPLKETKAAKPKRDVRVVRFERAKGALKRWQTKQRRAVTAIKKLRAQIKYYERTLQMAAGEKGETQ